MRKEYLVVGGVIGGSLLLMAGLAFLGARPQRPIADVMAACVQHTGIGMHIHPHLKIVLDGTERTIPANIGISEACMRPIHTHDETGRLHLEFPTVQEVRLGQFFTVWGQPFSRTQVLDRAVGPEDVLRVTVNGQETSEADQVVLHDGDDVVIEVQKQAADTRS